MTYPIQRTALILLAGTALTACASPRYPTQARLLDLPPPAVAAPAPAAPQQLAQAEAPLAPHASAPVESRPLAAPGPRAPETAAPAVAAAESAPVLAMEAEAEGEDAAARVRHRRHHAAAAPAEAAEPATYKVRKGDTLEKVAPKLGVDIETLAKLNGLKKPYRLHPGQVLHGPEPEGRAPAKGKAAGRAHAESYVVKKGDTLFSIAKAHGVTVEQLKAANHLGRSNSISHGQKLRMPGDEAEASADEAPAPRGRHRAEAPAEEPASHGAMGRVVEVEGAGRTYRVRRGDSAEKAARKLGVSVEELARLNHLKRPYHVRAGQTLHGAGGATSKAYVVARGDTLAAIAQRFGVSEAELRAANGLKRHAAVKPGRRLRLPGGSRDRGREEYQPPRYAPAPGQPLPPMRPSTPLPSQPQPYAPSGGGSGITGAPSASAPIPDAEISQRGRGLFAWPIKGAIIAGFGDRGGGQRNDGLDIRANAGDPVRAAAAGNVVYAGDQVPGFGNLVLIQHADGWVTAYGHLGKVDVRMQQKVSQGQQIGEAGTSGGVSEPQLHFEVRYKPSPDDRARPVDPALVLPR